MPWVVEWVVGAEASCLDEEQVLGTFHQYHQTVHDLVTPLKKKLMVSRLVTRQVEKIIVFI